MSERAIAWAGWERVLEKLFTDLPDAEHDDMSVYRWQFLSRLAYEIGWRQLMTWLYECKGDFSLVPLWARTDDTGEEELTVQDVRAILRDLMARHAREVALHPCPGCGDYVRAGRKGRLYCSNACRQYAYRLRRQVVGPAVTPAPANAGQEPAGGFCPGRNGITER